MCVDRVEEVVCDFVEVADYPHVERVEQLAWFS